MPSASTFTRFGMTLTLSAPANYFIFANDDFAIQQPFTITSITNANGAMINPSPKANQGLHGSMTGDGMAYVGSLDITLNLPWVVNSDCSIGAVIHKPKVGDTTYIREFAVWTALAVLPTSACLRPPYSGTDKVIKANWYVANFNYAALNRFPIPSPLPSNFPDPAYLESAVIRPLLQMPLNEFTVSEFANEDAAVYPRRDYGQNIPQISDRLTQWLNLDYSNATKARLLALCCQWGIDNLGSHRSGGQFFAKGGHSVGRTPPSVLAAMVLGDSEILASLGSLFIDNYLYDYVTQLDIDTPRTREISPGVLIDPYLPEHLGMPEWWSIKFSYERPTCSPNWGQNQGYRSIADSGTLGTVWLAQVMGCSGSLNPAAVDYLANRYWPTVSATEGLTQYLWNTHIIPPATPVAYPPAGVYTPGRHVRAASTTIGSTVRYTVGGATPDINSALMDLLNPPLISAATFKFAAFTAGQPASGILTSIYSLDATGLPVPPSEQTLTGPIPAHLA